MSIIALVNEEKCVVSQRLELTEFFSGCVPGVVEIAMFQDEFLILNKDVPHHLTIMKGMTFNQLAQLFRAADFFGDLESMENIRVSIKHLFGHSAGIDDIVRAYAQFADHPLSLLSKDYYTNFEIALFAMSHDETNMLHTWIEQSGDVQLTDIWERVAYAKSTYNARRRIEDEIRQYLRDSEHPPHIIVDWRRLHASGLSIEFIEEHVAHHRRQMHDMRVMPQYIIDLTYNQPMLSIDDLPIHEYALIFAHEHYNEHNWRELLSDEIEWPNRQWREYGIDRENIGTFMGEGLISTLLIADLLMILRVERGDLADDIDLDDDIELDDAFDIFE
jgi:hypothetical protein